MKSLWKSKKRFDIPFADQNLFLISFDDANDMEKILEGRLWLF